jgi:hypothetical protein
MGQDIPALQCRDGLAIEDPLILRAYLHEIAQACMAAYKSALLYFTLNLIIVPYHLIIVNIQFGKVCSLPQPRSQVSMRRRRSFACLVIAINLHIHGRLSSQLKATNAMIEVEPNRALRCKHSPPQASEAGRPVASFGVTTVCQPTEEAVEYSCPNFQHLKVSTRC